MANRPFVSPELQTVADPWPGMTAQQVELFEDNWQQMQTELVTLSPNATQVIANKSRHYIHLREPELVIDAVLNLAGQAALK